MIGISFPLVVFFDSDVMIAGSASTTGASHLLLQLSEVGIIRGIISRQVQEECRKNLKIKLAESQPLFNELISRCVKVVKNPGGSLLFSLKGQAHPKDIPILAAALKSGARFLVTFNVKHYRSSSTTGIKIVKPGGLLREIREYCSIK